MRSVDEIDAARVALRDESSRLFRVRAAVSEALRQLPVGHVEIGRGLQRAREQIKRRLQQIGVELGDLERAERRIASQE